MVCALAGPGCGGSSGPSAPGTAGGLQGPIRAVPLAPAAAVGWEKSAFGAVKGSVRLWRGRAACVQRRSRCGPCVSISVPFRGRPRAAPAAGPGPGQRRRAGHRAAGKFLLFRPSPRPPCPGRGRRQRRGRGAEPRPRPGPLPRRGGQRAEEQ